MSLSEPQSCSCAGLRQAARHVSQFYDAALAPVGLGLNQYSILSKVHRFGPISIQNLAPVLVMDRSTLGHLLRPLERRGLLTVRPCGRDRRSRIVEASAAGSALLMEARPLWAAAERRFIALVGGDAVRDLQAALARVTAIGFAASGESASGGSPLLSSKGHRSP